MKSTEALACQDWITRFFRYLQWCGYRSSLWRLLPCSFELSWVRKWVGGGWFFLHHHPASFWKVSTLVSFLWLYFLCCWYIVHFNRALQQLVFPRGGCPRGHGATFFFKGRKVPRLPFFSHGLLWVTLLIVIGLNTHLLTLPICPWVPRFWCWVKMYSLHIWMR